MALAVDNDRTLTSAYSLNFPQTQLAHWDLAQAEPSLFADALRTGSRIAGIVGGPPCQAFSAIGRRSAADPRRDLVWHYFRLVRALKPSFFIMENVPGLGFFDNREVLERALNLVATDYEIVGPTLLDAADFGAATVRRRLFVFGVDRSSWDVPALEDLPVHTGPRPTVRDAIGDLGKATMEPTDEKGFDWWRYSDVRDLSKYAADARREPPEGLGSAGLPGLFSSHRKTVHTPEVKQRFRELRAGQKDVIGKHIRLRWDGQSPTLRAGTGSDRGSYQSVRPVHPREARVITPREGARLQGFPDWFVFHPTVWHSFRMIGNSVSPKISTALFAWIAGAKKTNGRSHKR